jgi:deoxyribonuclease-4
MTSIVKGIEYELGVMGRLKTPQSQTGCVIHVGTWANKVDGIQTIAETLNQIHFPSQSGALLLENTAGGGTTIGRTFEELSQIYRLLNPEVQEHVKICIDTQHIYASGQYNLQREDEVDRLFREFQCLFPIDRLGLVHFNDSSSVFNSQVDNHAFLGTGEIWRDHSSALIYTLETIERLRIPVLIE